jgi:hypothetical protein
MAFQKGQHVILRRGSKCKRFRAGAELVVVSRVSGTDRWFVKSLRHRSLRIARSVIAGEHLTAKRGRRPTHV